MIGLDATSGFALLLLIPLLLWGRKRRSKARLVTLTIFPVLADMDSRPLEPTQRRFRLSHFQRYTLLTAALLCLALAANGIHLIREEDHPGQWLVVLDNTYALNAASGGRDLAAIIGDGLAGFVSSLPDGDTVTLVTTSPVPVITPGLPPARAAGAILKIGGSREYMEPAPLVEYLVELTRGMKLKGAYLVSPRSNLLRPLLAEASEDDTFIVPDELQVLYGNRGITAANLQPAGEGNFDIYLAVETANLPAAAATIVLTTGSGDHNTFQIYLPENGAGSMSLKDIPLPHGVSSLAISGKDTLTSDDSVTLNVPETDRPLALSLAGDQDPWLADALVSRRGFLINPDGVRADVAVYLRDAPARAPSTPFLLIFPTRGLPGFEFRRVITAPTGAVFSPGHPVTAHAAFRNFRPLKLVEIGVPGNSTVVASVEGIPLVTTGETEGRRFVIWHFDPADTGIYLDPAFPILLRESIRWLAGFDLKSEGLLDARITEDAGTVTVPDPAKLAPGAEADITRTDIARPFILLALLIFLLLLADRLVSLEMPA